MTADELQAIELVHKSGWFLHGPEVARLEESFPAFLGVNQGVAVSSGTDALTLALAAVGVASGSRVATVANAGPYATVALRRLGAAAVYVDVDRDTACMSAHSLCERLHEVEAVIVTHLYGRIADMGELRKVVDTSGVPLIEDCAHAVGARAYGRSAGAFGDLAAFSFYPTKNLGALGDAGMVVGRNAALLDRVRQLAQYGWRSRFVVEMEGGINSRMDEIQAAVLNIRLSRLDPENLVRRGIARRYRAALDAAGVPDQLLFIDDPAHVAHLAVVRAECRNRLIAHLARYGIETAIHYPVPDYCQPAWRDTTVRLPVTDSLAGQVVSIPCFPKLTDSEISRVEDALSTYSG